MLKRSRMIELKKVIEISKSFYDNNNSENDFDDYQEHVIMVGACASVIASACGLDVKKAGLMGYCHDIGKLISDEKKEKTFHGLVGYEYFKSIHEDEIAQICLSHSFPCKNFSIGEYIGYGEDNILKAKKILDNLTLTDYDVIIQLSDLLVCISSYVNLKTRMDYIEKVYSIDKEFIRRKYKNAIHLKKYIENKYNCNIYQLLGIK